MLSDGDNDNRNRNGDNDNREWLDVRQKNFIEERW